MLALAFSKLAFVASAVCQMASSMLMRVPAAPFCRASACCPALFVRCPKHYCVMSLEQGVWEQMTAMSVLLVATHAQTGWRIFSGLVTFPSNQILGYSHLLYEAAENCKCVANSRRSQITPTSLFLWHHVLQEKMAPEHFWLCFGMKRAEPGSQFEDSVGS